MANLPDKIQRLWNKLKKYLISICTLRKPHKYVFFIWVKMSVPFLNKSPLHSPLASKTYGQLTPPARTNGHTLSHPASKSKQYFTSHKHNWTRCIEWHGIPENKNQFMISTIPIAKNNQCNLRRSVRERRRRRRRIPERSKKCKGGQKRRSKRRQARPLSCSTPPLGGTNAVPPRPTNPLTSPANYTYIL